MAYLLSKIVDTQPVHNLELVRLARNEMRNLHSHHIWASRCLKEMRHDEFLAAEDKDWVVDGKKSGRIRQVGPFTFQQVYEAGHMVPLDQPKNALAMLKAFTLPEENEEEDGEVTDYVEQQRSDKQLMAKDESVMSIM